MIVVFTAHFFSNIWEFFIYLFIYLLMFVLWQVWGLDMKSYPGCILKETNTKRFYHFSLEITITPSINTETSSRFSCSSYPNQSNVLITRDPLRLYSCSYQIQLVLKTQVISKTNNAWICWNSFKVFDTTCRILYHREVILSDHLIWRNLSFLLVSE